MSLLAGGRPSEGQEGPQISLEYQIHPPTIDTLVTGMVVVVVEVDCVGG